MSEISFNVSARTARLIGQENFTSSEGAVIELVKNSYDADASISIVLIDVFNDCIYVIDNGDGMTSEIIKEHWMTIGTDNKAYQSPTNNNRIKTGAKGIGRFALDRLGSECEMWTKTKDETGVYWSINWKQFETKNKSITDIKATLEFYDLNFETRLIELFGGFDLYDGFYDNWTESGTIIKIKYLKDSWQEATILDLQDSLETLIPPLEKDYFRLFLYSTRSKDKFGEIIPTELEDFDYKFIAEVNDNQKVKITIQRNEMVFEQLKSHGLFESPKLPNELQFKEEAFKNGQFVIDTSFSELLPGQKNNDISDSLSKIGSFTFIFYFLKRGGAQEQREEGLNKFPYRQNINYKERVNWLKRFGGIKIFRDNFRVRPYGEPKSSSFDWLGLGSRTLQGVNPNRGGWKVGANQVYGLVQISRIGNISFEDKSSREGLQENVVFVLFKQILLKIIEKFERDRTYVIYSLGEIDKVRSDAAKNKQRADEIIADEEKKEEKKQKKGIIEELFEDKDKKILVDAIKTYKEELEELKDEQKIMRALASSGLVVTSFAHEFSHIRNRIVSRTDDLITILKDVVDEDKRVLLDESDDPYLLIKDIREQDERVKNWLDFALFSVQKSKRNSRKINLNEYVNSLERLWSSLLKHLKATIVIEKSKLSIEAPFIGHEIDLDSIFNNLIVNSIDSFTNPKNKGDKREIKLNFVSDTNDIIISYEDSGAGLSTDITNQDDIFKAFFTTKRDARTGEEIGTGLGMWIVQTVVESYKGDIKLLHARPGIKFMIKLPYNN